MAAPPAALGEVPVDLYRAFVFPNRVREERRRCGFPKLLALSSCIPDIPYIRLSKIERGEVFARAEELIQVAEVLRCAPKSLLIDVDAPDFRIAEWAEPFLDRRSSDPEAERLCVLLGAALRERRSRDRALTMAVLDKEFGLPPVIVSRIETAQKTLDRWNAATTAGLCRLFGVEDRTALIDHIVKQHAAGALDPFLASVGSPELRLSRTRERVAAIRSDLDGGVPAQAGLRGQTAQDLALLAAAPATRMLPVFGAPLPGGLVAQVPTGLQAPAPLGTGPKSFALRVCRPTLGGGLPGSATVIVDPDRYPSGDGIVVIREGAHHRLLATAIDRTGAMVGYSVSPAWEVALDSLSPADVAVVTAVLLT